MPNYKNILDCWIKVEYYGILCLNDQNSIFSKSAHLFCQSISYYWNMFFSFYKMENVNILINKY